MNKLLKPWIFATIGGIIIIISVSISTIIVLMLQTKLDTIKSELKGAEQNLILSNYSTLIADINFNFNTTRKNIIKTRASFFQEEKIQKSFDEAYAAILESIIIGQYRAIGKKPDFENLQKLIDRVIDGDNTSLDTMHDIYIEMTKSVGYYKRDLAKKIAYSKVRVNEVESKIRKTLFIAAFFQIIGLVVLLLKELPEELYKKICTPATNERKNETALGIQHHGSCSDKSKQL